MDKLVGEYLKDLSAVTSSQIVDALRSQVILKDGGDRRLLGELLLAKGHITKEQLDEALRVQRLERGWESEPPWLQPLPDFHNAEQSHSSLM